jgi:adenylosuccinate lyase
MTRDKLLAELAENQQNMAAELEPLREELAAVVAIIEKQEAPKKRREELGQLISSCRERASVRLRELKASIEKSAPTFLRDAISRVKSEGAVASCRSDQDPFLGQAHRVALRERAQTCDVLWPNTRSKNSFSSPAI